MQFSPIERSPVTVKSPRSVHVALDDVVRVKESLIVPPEIVLPSVAEDNNTSASAFSWKKEINPNVSIKKDIIIVYI